jgi:ATP-dependent DNA ligase
MCVGQTRIVARIDYLEWTEGDHLRHAKFAGLREDKNALSVFKENPATPNNLEP